VNDPADSGSAGSGVPELGAAIRALKRDPQALRILLACTLAAVVTVFEPGYLTLSTSLVQTGLRAPNSPAPLILAAAFLVLALITLLAGTSADVFGRRKFLVVGLAGVAVSNLLGLIWLGTPHLFVIADVLTTVSGVIVLPAAVAIVTLAFGPALRPFAYGVLFGVQGTALVVSALLVPLLGNVWDGRAAFIPVLVLSVVALVRVRREVPESRAPTSLHRGGIVLNLVFVSGLFALLFLVVTKGIRAGESLVALAVGAVLLLFALGVREVTRRSSHFAGIEIYGGRDLGMAILAGLMLMFAQGCFFYQIYPFFQDVQQVGDVAIAFRYVPYLVGLMAGGLLVARVLLRFGPRLILAFSFLLMGVALLGLSALRVDSPFWVMIVPITLVGCAAGLGGPARTTVVMGGRPPGIVNGSAAVNTAAGQGGYALGVIISSVLVTQHADRLFVEGLRIAGVPADIVAKVVTAMESTAARLMVTRYPICPTSYGRSPTSRTPMRSPAA
jgi:DHA2 family multidrug resistance protein-like MFS transporter